MRRLASIVALLLLLVTAAPVLACMTGSTMTREEHACCRAMHGNCGSMASMGCCRTQVRTDERPQMAASAPTVALHWVVIGWWMPALLSHQAVPSPVREIPSEHSPPGAFIAAIIVLQI